MRTIRSTARTTITRVAAAVLVAGALAGCTVLGSTTGTPAAAPTTAGPTTTPAPEGPVGNTEVAVAAALSAYQRAVAVGDYVLACSQMTAESAARLVTAVRAGSGLGAGAEAVVPGCVEAMGAVLAQPGAAEAAIEAANTVTVTDVTVQGLTATVRWTSTRQGVPRTDALTLQQVDLQWRLAGTA